MSLNHLLTHWEQIRAQLLATIDKFNEFSPCQNGGVAAYLYVMATT